MFGTGTGNKRNHSFSLGREQKIQKLILVVQDENGKTQISERDKPIKLCSRYLGRERKLPKSFLAIWDRNGNYQKAFLRFGVGTGHQKNSSCCLGTGIQGVPVGKYMGMGITAHV